MCYTGFFLVIFSSISLFLIFEYLNILINGVVNFQVSLFVSHGFLSRFYLPCFHYISFKKKYILSQHVLKMVQTPCGSLAQA